MRVITTRLPLNRTQVKNAIILLARETGAQSVRTWRDRACLFPAACNMGLEGLVSKRRDRPYQESRSKDWIKVKNRKHRRFDGSVPMNRIGLLVQIYQNSALSMSPAVRGSIRDLMRPKLI